MELDAAGSEAIRNAYKQLKAKPVNSLVVRHTSQSTQNRAHTMGDLLFSCPPHIVPVFDSCLTFPSPSPLCVSARR